MLIASSQSSVSPWPLRGVITFLLAAALLPVSHAQSVSFAGATPSVNFGTANVCSAGKTTPTPCSQNITLTYKVTESGTLGTPQALTVGAPNLDYKVASGTTCTGSVTQGNTCKINVTFAPTAPGQRHGAIEIFGPSGDLLATTYIYGSAVGPLAGFGPPALNTLLAAAPSSGDIYLTIAVDGSGNVFFTVPGVGCLSGSVEELVAVNGSIPANPVVRNLTIPGFFNPRAVAIDGAGNLFVGFSDTCPAEVTTPDVAELLAAGDYTTVKYISGSFSSVSAIRVDDSRNIFAVDMGNVSTHTKPAVKELLAANGYAAPVTLGGGFAFNSPDDLALDSNGNLFVADNFVPDGPFSGAVEELPAAGGYNTVKTIHVSDTANQVPSGITIDSANNIFLTFGSTVGEFFAVDGVIPPNPAAVYFPIPANTGGPGTVVIALDGRGNIYITNTTDIEFNSGLIQELQFYPASPLNFATTPVGRTSTDSPKPIQLQNKGNAPLDLSALSISPNWDLIPGSGTPADCTGSTSLTSGALCNLSISFEPTEAGPLTGAVTLTDNSLDAPGSTQSIPLSGIGTLAGPQITSLSVNYGAWYATTTLTGINFGATQGSTTVTFNGTVAPVLSWSNTSITVTVPYRATTGNVLVTVGSQASNTVPFTVEPYPTITGISPTSNQVGGVVTITGTNLLDTHGRGTVYLSDKPLPIISESSTSLAVEIPSGAASGAMDVHVNGVGLYTPVFTVTVPTHPHLTSLSANYGAPYAYITLTGSNFGDGGGSTVTFNGVVAPVASWTNSSIVVAVPLYATTGNVVVTAIGQASNGLPFTLEPRGTITAISPASGPVGTTVTITGTNLLDAQGRGSVWMGNVQVPVISQSATSVKVQIPDGATNNPINIYVNGVGNYTPVFTVN